MPVFVMRGLKPGPVVFLSAAIHGDEINGTEIIREVVQVLSKRKIRGTVITVPVVNVFGFNNQSRYLPDRRDLNRSFPGNNHGSLSSRMAQLFMKEIVSKCTHGIDFHTGALHRSNLPQVRANLEDSETFEFAKSFQAPIIINSKMRDGSLRDAARKKGVITLLFEGGQALRFEDKVIKVGKRGCLNALKHIGVLSGTKKDDENVQSLISQGSAWVRAPMGGILRLRVKEGQFIKKNNLIGMIRNPHGNQEVEIKSQKDGCVIGVNKLPLVNTGDAVIHLATLEKGEGLPRDQKAYFYDET